MLMVFTTLSAFSQRLDSIFQSLHRDKQIYDNVLNKKVTTKGIYYFDCIAKEGYNKKIDQNTIAGSKLRVCDDSKGYFFYLYSLNSKELHILTTYPYDENDPNSFELAVKNISDIYIFDSSEHLKYIFLMPVIEPQHYQLKRFALKNGTFRFEKGKSVEVLKDSIICKPHPCRSYFKNNRPICDFNIKEYFDMIEILKKELDSE